MALATYDLTVNVEREKITQSFVVTNMSKCCKVHDPPTSNKNNINGEAWTNGRGQYCCLPLILGVM